MENNVNNIGQGINPNYNSPVWQRSSGFGESLAGGLATALEGFAHNRLEELKRKKRQGLLTGAGIRPEYAALLDDIRETDPKLFGELIQNLGTGAYQQQEGAGQLPFKGKGSAAQQVALEKYKDTHRDKLNYLLKMRSKAEELKSLLNSGKVDLNAYNAVVGRIPAVGNYLTTGEQTSSLQQLADQFHTDLAQEVKGVKSKYYTELLGNSKPGINKTKAQNDLIVDRYLKIFDKDINNFLRAHPEFREEVAQGLEASQGDFSEPQEQQAASVGPLGAKVRDKKTGQYFMWNPETEDYDIPVKE